MTRAVPLLGYVYVALALPAFFLNTDHLRAATTLFTPAAFAFLWFLASLRSKLIRYDPDGFFASIVLMGGASLIALQAIALWSSTAELNAPAAACAASIIIASSLAALQARKVSHWFGRAGVLGGIAVLGVGLVEGADGWTLARSSIWASTIGFMIWVVVTATYLWRRT